MNRWEREAKKVRKGKRRKRGAEKSRKGGEKEGCSQEGVGVGVMVVKREGRDLTFHAPSLE
jgi:hypothetical protein